jgi:hypothetical protein
LPTLPRNAFRLRADWSHGPFALGDAGRLFDAQYSRGSRNNADPAGKVPGYAVVALDGSWNITPEWRLFARVDNLFNRTYQNFGILGANYFRGPGNTFDAGLAGPEAFRSPGAPFGAWIGIQYRLDRGTGAAKLSSSFISTPVRIAIPTFSPPPAARNRCIGPCCGHASGSSRPTRTF